MLGNKLSCAFGNAEKMYLWHTLTRETSCLLKLSVNHTATFSLDFSRTWLILESSSGS